MSRVQQFIVQGSFILFDNEMRGFIEQNCSSLTELEITRIPSELCDEETGTRTSFWRAVNICFGLQKLTIEDLVSAHWDWPEIICHTLHSKLVLKKLVFECKNMTAIAVLNCDQFFSAFIAPWKLEELSLYAPECRWCIDFISRVACLRDSHVLPFFPNLQILSVFPADEGLSLEVQETGKTLVDFYWQVPKLVHFQLPHEAFQPDDFARHMKAFFDVNFELGEERVLILTAEAEEIERVITGSLFMEKRYVSRIAKNGPRL